jgi:hypothetical protein
MLMARLAWRCIVFTDISDNKDFDPNQQSQEVSPMLGEKIGEETGRITGRRVLPDEGMGPKVEVTFEGKGLILGVETADIGTYWSIVRPDGTLYGEGQGVIMGKNGEGASWKGGGVGKFTGGGGTSIRGAIYFNTSSPKWVRLNGVAVLFEFETDPDGKTHTVDWEWK